MTVTASRPTGSRADGRPASALGPRRAPRHMLVGITLMVAFALLFGLAALRADPATSVLAVARPVPAGATIRDADLRVVRVVPGAGVEVVTEAERATVVGRTATVPLVAGALLAPAHVGAVMWPPAGESVVGVPVAAGRMPAGLSTGSRVSVLVGADGAPGQPGQPGRPERPVVSGVVVAVEPPSAAGVSTVSLLMSSAVARQVAAAGEVVLILEPAGG